MVSNHLRGHPIDYKEVSVHRNTTTETQTLKSGREGGKQGRDYKENKNKPRKLTKIERPCPGLRGFCISDLTVLVGPVAFLRALAVAPGIGLELFCSGPVRTGGGLSLLYGGLMAALLPGMYGCACRPSRVSKGMTAPSKRAGTVARQSPPKCRPHSELTRQLDSEFVSLRTARCSTSKLKGPLNTSCIGHSQATPTRKRKIMISTTR
jgi:hypothetical protein